MTFLLVFPLCVMYCKAEWSLSPAVTSYEHLLKGKTDCLAEMRHKGGTVIKTEAMMSLKKPKVKVTQHTLQSYKTHNH